MARLTYRQMRVKETGILQMAATIAAQRERGWVLLEDLVTVRGKQVRLVFGKDEPSARGDT